MNNAEQINIQRILFKGLRRYWDDQAVWSFEVIFNLDNFLNKYPEFSNTLTTESIVSKKSSFNEIAAALESQSEVDVEVVVFTYLLHLHLETLDNDDQFERFDTFEEEVFDPFSPDQFFSSSVKEESIQMEQEWMIMSIEAL